MSTVTRERRRIEKAGTLQWFHWVVISLSLCLTLVAWNISHSQIEEKVERQFNREADQVIELVKERMELYENALWSGVAMIQAQGGEVSHPEWRRYSRELRIDHKYPGVNGIGVIFSRPTIEIPDLIEEQRQTRPDFRVFPEHDEPVSLPIIYVEPEDVNSKAVGLDMAHETNRYRAALRARDLGTAQITGPIVLVQDETRTPGFLFYTPYYRGGDPETLEERRERFLGMVYAPFVVEELMKGALASQNRHVGLRIQDGDDVLFNEHEVVKEDFDPEPLFRRTDRVSLYGREWSFDIRSDQSFRSEQNNAQPLTILIGGLFIEALLILLFVTISRTNRRALAYADEASKEAIAKAVELEQLNAELERSNEELEHFAYVASHDLQEPLRMVGSFAELLDAQYADSFDDQGRKWLGFMTDGARRMQALVRDLLTFSRAGRSIEMTPVDSRELIDLALENLAHSLEDEVRIEVKPDLPRILADAGQISSVFQNLISNAIKFRREGAPAVVEVGFEEGRSSEKCIFYVRDEGIGIDEEFLGRIFVIFQRLHGKFEYSGTGLGLAICKKIVEKHGGRIWVWSAPGQGSTFYFSIPRVTEETLHAIPTP